MGWSGQLSGRRDSPNSALTAVYHVADGHLPKGMTVSRACVADFMVKEAERPAHVRQIVGLSK